VAGAARDVAPRSAVTRLAWALCLLSVLLAVAALFLAAVNGLNLLELIANHHAIGIMDALVLAPIGALIVVGDRRHLLAWLLLADGLVLGALNVAEQYAPLALGLTPRRLSLPGGELASWVASWAFVPGIVIGVVFLVLLFPDGRLPSRRWWPLGLAGAAAMAVPTVVLAVGTWPLRGPALVPPEGEEPDLVTAVFGITLMTTLALGAISVVALVLRFRRAGAVQRQQIKWFAYLAAPSVPLGMFAQVRPYGPYLELLGAALQLAGLVLLLGRLSGELGGRPPSWVVAGATLAVAALFQPARRRIQAVVDRRFNRARYDAARTVGAFAARLRDQVDLDTLSAELLAVVDRTMQPTATSLWLRPSAADPALASPPART
jgi:hypothetical protein